MTKHKTEPQVAASEPATSGDVAKPMSAFDVWALAEAYAALANVEGTFADAESRNDETLLRYRTLSAKCTGAGLTENARAAAHECLRLRAKIKAGDGGAVLDAIGLCAEHSLVIPQWLADEYLRRHGAVGRGWAKDWNDERAFGLAYPKGTNIAGVRAKAEDAPAAYVYAARLLSADPVRPIDAGFYEAVGAHIGVGKTRAQELLAMALMDKRYSCPPLANLRKKLAAGLTLDGALRELSDESFSAEYLTGDPGK